MSTNARPLDPDMEARRDAFLMATDELAPSRPGRWLVTWTDESGAHDWSVYDRPVDAIAKAGLIQSKGLAARIHDLDDRCA